MISGEKERCSHTTAEIEEGEKRTAEDILDKRPADEKEQQVAEKMQEAEVDEHRRENVNGTSLGWDVAEADPR